MGLFPTGQRFFDRSTVKLGQNLVVGHALGIADAKDLIQPFPEIRQPHPRKSATHGSRPPRSGQTRAAWIQNVDPHDGNRNGRPLDTYGRTWPGPGTRR
jgi:hypothetical protein